MAANAVALTGVIVAIESLRHTPAGVPIVGITLRHQSAQTEAGMARQTVFDVAAVVMGEAAQSAAHYRPGDAIAVRGFLAARNYKGAQVGTQLVLHVTHLEKFIDTNI